MPINRGPAAKNQNVDAFIGKAPDASRKGVIRGRKEQITLTITPDLLAKVDELAEKMGQSRAALINRAIYELNRVHFENRGYVGPPSGNAPIHGALGPDCQTTISKLDAV